MLILAKGCIDIKTVDGKRVQVLPYLGSLNDHDYAPMGIGYHTVDDSSSGFKTVGGGLIRSWRAMCILEAVPAIKHETLDACWHAATAEGNVRVQPSVYALALLFNSIKEFDDLRRYLLKSVPDFYELDSILRTVRSNKIDIDERELRHLVEQGLIDEHPVIDWYERRQKTTEGSSELLLGLPVADLPEEEKRSKKRRFGLFGR